MAGMQTFMAIDADAPGKRVYVVMGQNADATWPVIAYLSRENAEAHKNAAGVEALLIKERAMAADVPPAHMLAFASGSAHDKNLSFDVEGRVDYWVMTVAFGDWVLQA